MIVFACWRVGVKCGDELWWWKWWWWWWWTWVTCSTTSSPHPAGHTPPRTPARWWCTPPSAPAQACRCTDPPTPTCPGGEQYSQLSSSSASFLGGSSFPSLSPGSLPAPPVGLSLLRALPEARVTVPVHVRSPSVRPTVRLYACQSVRPSVRFGHLLTFSLGVQYSQSWSRACPVQHQ